MTPVPPYCRGIRKWHRGGATLGKQVGNYNFAYQFMISLLVHLPISPLSAYKFLSSIFDVTLALSAGRLAQSLLYLRKGIRDKSLFCLVSTLVLWTPTVWLDSSVWAQCDSIYATFVVLTLVCMVEKKFPLAAAFLGLAMSFKLQAIFIVPFVLLYYIRQKSFSILLIFVSVTCFYVPCLPGLIAGRGLLDPIRVYLDQTSVYPGMWFGYPSFWALVGNDYASLKVPAILTAVALFALLHWYISRNKVDLSNPSNFLYLASLTTWSCVILLPAMHERYGYVSTVLLLIASAYDRKVLPFFLITGVLDCITYGTYLYGANGGAFGVVPDGDMRLLAITNLIAYVLYFRLALKGLSASAAEKTTPQHLGI